MTPQESDQSAMDIVLFQSVAFERPGVLFPPSFFSFLRSDISSLSDLRLGGNPGANQRNKGSQRFRNAGNEVRSQKKSKKKDVLSQKKNRKNGMSDLK